MSDNEEEWKPSGRPQSTMALSLAATLDDAFMLDSDVDSLSNSIHYKQQMVTIQNRELEALETKIREAEQRLQKSGGEGGSSDSGETVKPKESSQATERNNATEKSHNPQFSSSSSGSQPSDEDSTGSAASGVEGPADGRYKNSRGVTKQDEKGKKPQF